MDRSRALTGYADGMEKPPFGKVRACPRPTCLKEFVGQHRLKALIGTTVASAKQRNAPFPHTAVSGQAGSGKTTIASIIAHEMLVDFIPVSPDSLVDAQAVRELMRSISDYGYDRSGKVVDSIQPPVIFVDEAHRLPRQSQELLYSCLEDRILDTEVHNPLMNITQHVREWVPFFTLVAATNRPGKLAAPFRDRLRLHVRLDSYSSKDGRDIALVTLSQLGISCGKATARGIAEQSRCVPRLIISNCERIRDFLIARGRSKATPRLADLAFESIGVDFNGLARTDVQLLKHLAIKPNNPLGISTLASLLGEEEDAIEGNIEPFLLSRNYILRTARGRIITSAGLAVLEQSPWRNE